MIKCVWCMRPQPKGICNICWIELKEMGIRVTQICTKCERPFREGDHVRAVVLSVFHDIPSSRSYAIEKPYECEKLTHLQCTKRINA
jgi:hypothetical protein